MGEKYLLIVLQDKSGKYSSGMVTNNPPVLCYHQESLVFVVLQKWQVEAGYQIKYFFEIDVDKQVP